MNRRLATLVVLVAGQACGGGGGSGSADAGGDDDDAPPAADAGPPADLVTTDEDGSPIETLTAPDAPLGQATAALLHVVNGGDTATGAIALSIEGEAAADFEIVAEVTTCAGLSLAAGQSCDVAILFHPSAAGTRSASLSIASEPGGTVSIALLGEGFASTVHVAPGEVAFGTLAPGDSGQTTLEVVNDGPGGATIDAIAIDDPAFALGLDTCGATLAAGATCDVVVGFTATDVAAHVGTLTVTAGGVAVPVALSGRGAMPLVVTRSGEGSGAVISSPVGIDCGGDCAGLFTSDVLLTATPADGSVFTGWSLPACGAATTCIVPLAVASMMVDAGFALTGTASLSIVFAGDAPGEIRVRREDPETGKSILATCFSSCTVPIESGDQLQVTAVTPSRFGGLAGACTLSATAVDSYYADCTFTAAAGTSTVTASFARDPAELWTRLIAPGATLDDILCDSAGNALVPTTGGLIKLAAATGSTVWTKPIAPFALGPDDSMFAYEAGGMVKRDADGAVVWSTAVAGGVDFAVSTSGTSAVRAAGQLTRLNPAGGIAWSRALTGTINDVAVDSAGLVYLTVESDNFESQDARRFAAADGAELTPLEDVALQYQQGDLRIDPADHLVTSSSGHSNVHLVRTAPTGVRDWARLFEGGFAAYVDNAVAVGTSGRIGWWHWIDESYGDGGRRQRVIVFSNAGAELWTLLPRLYASDNDAYRLGAYVESAAMCGNGNLILSGRFTGLTYDGGWVQAFAP